MSRWAIENFYLTLFHHKPEEMSFFYTTFIPKQKKKSTVMDNLTDHWLIEPMISNVWAFLQETTCSSSNVSGLKFVLKAECSISISFSLWFNFNKHLDEGLCRYESMTVWKHDGMKTFGKNITVSRCVMYYDYALKYLLLFFLCLCKKQNHQLKLNNDNNSGHKYLSI